MLQITLNLQTLHQDQTQANEKKNNAAQSVDVSCSRGRNSHRGKATSERFACV